MWFQPRAVTPSQIEVKLRQPSVNKDMAVFSQRVRHSRAEHPHLAQVSSYLFWGCIEAAYNEQLLCSYNIVALVDVSGIHPSRVARNRKSSCPCTCPLTVAHSRAKLSVHLEDNEKEDFRPYLREINTFIHSQRCRQRNVLVFSDAGLCRAPAIIAQYLVQIEHRSLVLTLAHMRTLRPQLCINPSFLRILRKVERDAIRRPSRDVGPVTETPAMAIKFVSGIQRFMTKTPTTGQLLSAPLGLSSTGTPADNRLLFAKTGRLASFHRSIKQAWS